MIFESYEKAVNVPYFWVLAVRLTLLDLRRLYTCFMAVLQPNLRRAGESYTLTPPLYGVRVYRPGDSVGLFLDSR